MNSKDLKRRINGVRETAKITSAVHLISTSKMRRLREVFLSSKLFLDEAYSTATTLMGLERAKSHPLFAQRDGNNVAYVVIGGDKGLCGDYNQLIINAADLSMKNKNITNLFAVGNIIKEYYDEKEGINVDNSYVHLFPDPTPQDAKAIAEVLCADFKAQKMDKAYIIYTKADKLSAQKISISRILPLDTIDCSEEVTFLSGDDTFENIIKQYVWAKIYQALSSAACAVTFKRMISMQEATTNGETILEELQKTYNKERQENITNALLDASVANMGKALY